jgi:uncharacterized iron-regulated membrane protein
MASIELDLPAAARLPPKKDKASRLWWHVHQWAGLKLSLFMAFICLTGTIAVFSAEIDWLLHPTLRVDPATVQGATRWGAIAENAARYPNVERIDYIAAPTAKAFAVRVTIERVDRSRGYLHAHPTTGKIQGEQGWVDTQRIFRNLHRHLNLPTKVGVPIVTSLSLLLITTFITSFFVYKKWWRGFTKPIRTRNARTGWGDYHRLAGVWSLWFVLLIALSGFWYLVEALGGKAPDLPKVQIAATSDDAVAIADSLAASIEAARRASPVLSIESIRFPDKKSGAFVIEGQKTAWLVRARANSVWTNPATGKALLSTDGAELNVHQRISEMADPLHFGTWGGYWTKIIWFAFGLLLTSLSVSGAAIYSLRIAREVGQSELGPARRAWLGMGRLRWAATALVATAVLLVPTLFLDAAG